MKRYIAVDSETYLIAPGNPCPRLVCVTTAEGVPGGEMRARIYDRVAGMDVVRALLADSKVVIIGANIYYDLGVFCAEDPTLVPVVFQAFEDGRIRDVQVRQKLRDIRDGKMKWTLDENGEPTKQKYSLADLVFRYFGRDRSGEKLGPDVWRLRYSELDGVPADQWPEAARDYALKDASDTLEVFLNQYRDDEPIELNGDIIPPTGDDTIVDELAQTRYQWALQLMSIWGVRTDAKAVDELEQRLKQLSRQIASGFDVETEVPPKFLDDTGEIPDQLRSGLMGTGLLKPDGSRNMKAIYDRVTLVYDGNPPVTPSGRPGTDGDTLLESGDPVLAWLRYYQGTNKVISKDLKDLRSGVYYPINARWNGLVESGRISCSGPNLANPPREGGVREGFIPRKGNVFIDIDLDTIELRALAQCNLDLQGQSMMAEAILRGEDLHSSFGADLAGSDYLKFISLLEEGDRGFANFRQFAKIWNFGKPGGMGTRSMVSYAKGYGIVVGIDQAKDYDRRYLNRWQEMPGYFALVKRWIGSGDTGYAIQRRSNRIRGGCRFTQLCNTLFQGLVADATKSALWALCKACYLGELQPARIVLFLYDQFVLECPEHLAAAYAPKVQKIVLDAVQPWMPDIPVKGKPALARRFYKGPKPVMVGGQLVPSKPVMIDGRTKWVHDTGEVS